MTRAGILPVVFTVSIVVNAHCKDGQIKKASDFIEKMEKKGF